ncbi:MAG: hypothetical protein WEB28_02950 [Nitrosopumilaceae archaeon]
MTKCKSTGHLGTIWIRISHEFKSKIPEEKAQLDLRLGENN